MKRLTSILAISVIAVMSAGAARADIASTTYVDKQVAPVSTKANTNANAIETLKLGKENVANKVASGGDMEKKLKEADADTKYPTLKAALEIAQIAAGAATEDLGDLTARVGTAESNITSLQSGKQNKLVSGENGNINGSNGVSVTVGTDGKIAVSGNQSAIDTAIGKKADTATVNAELAKKQNTLTEAQLAAANSGITLTKVATYDGYDTTIKANTSAAAAAKSAADAAQTTADAKEASANKTKTYDAAATDKDTKFPTISAAEAIADAKVAGANTDITKLKEDVAANKTAIAGKQATLNTTQLAAVNSGATKTKIDAIATNTTAAANAKSAADAAQATADSLKTSKQDKLTEKQLNAANSGITEAKVATYDGYGEKITTAQNTANTAKTTAEAAIAAPAAATTSTDGVYTLTMEVVNGIKTYAWEQIGR